MLCQGCLPIEGSIKVSTQVVKFKVHGSQLIALSPSYTKTAQVGKLFESIHKPVAKPQCHQNVRFSSLSELEL